MNMFCRLVWLMRLWVWGSPAHPHTFLWLWWFISEKVKCTGAPQLCSDTPTCRMPSQCTAFTHQHLAGLQSSFQGWITGARLPLFSFQLVQHIPEATLNHQRPPPGPAEVLDLDANMNEPEPTSKQWQPWSHNEVAVLFYWGPFHTAVQRDSVWSSLQNISGCICFIFPKSILHVRISVISVLCLNSFSSAQLNYVKVFNIYTCQGGASLTKKSTKQFWMQNNKYLLVEGKGEPNALWGIKSTIDTKGKVVRACVLQLDNRACNAVICCCLPHDGIPASPDCTFAFF